MSKWGRMEVGWGGFKGEERTKTMCGSPEMEKENGTFEERETSLLGRREGGTE